MSPDVIGNKRFNQFRDIIYRALDSRITADSVVKRLIDEEHVDPAHFEQKDLERVFGGVVFTSVRLFCAEDKLPIVMMELADLMKVPNSD